MSKSNWKYNFEIINDNEAETIENICIYKFENIDINAKITNIEITRKIVECEFSKLNSHEWIIIKFSNLKRRDEIYEELKIMEIKYDIIIDKNKNMIKLYYKKYRKDLYNDAICYLEKLDEVRPLNILKKILYVEKRLDDDIIYGDAKILKNMKNPNIKLIHFEYLSMKYEKYHDKFISLLDFDQKLKILEYNKKYQYEYNKNLLNSLINENLNINEINKIIKIIDLLSKYNEKYDKIYKSTNIYFQYLNHLSIEDILKELKNDITNNRSFEIINYLYSQNDLSLDQTIQLIQIMNNERFREKDLIILKNKITCKLINFIIFFIVFT